MPELSCNSLCTATIRQLKNDLPALDRDSQCLIHYISETTGKQPIILLRQEFDGIESTAEILGQSL
jgi:hypothetical protein